MSTCGGLLFLAVALWAGGAAAQAQDPAPTPAQPVESLPPAPLVPDPAALEALARQEFRDQVGGTGSLAAQLGAPVVAVVVHVKRLAMIEKWERDLTTRVPGIRFLNVADLPTDVPVDLDRTALTLQKRLPPGVPVLMDPTRAWATTFGLDTEAPNLLVFDATGALTARFRGRWTEALAAEVAAAVPRGAAAP